MKDITLNAEKSVKGTSKVSLLCYRFYFKEGDDEISVFASCWSGLESVYLNDTLVSKETSFGLKNEHKFTSKAKSYSVLLEITNLLKGEARCSLYVDDQYLAGESNSYVDGPGLPVYCGVSFLFGASFFLALA